MALDFEEIIFGVSLLVLGIVILFVMLRLSNRLIAKKIGALTEKQKALERQQKKLVFLVLDNKKKLERKIHTVEKETEKPATEAVPSREIAVARETKKR